MRNIPSNNFTDRRSAAANAKAHLLSAFLTAKEMAAPTRLARQAERASFVAARDARRSEKARLKLEEQNRLQAIEVAKIAAVEAAAVAEKEERNRAENARIARLVEDESVRKAERDRRYAARKARQA